MIATCQRFTEINVSNETHTISTIYNVTGYNKIVVAFIVMDVFKNFMNDSVFIDKFNNY